MSISRYLSKLGGLLNSSGLILPEALANGGAEFGSNNVLINGGLDVWQRATSFSNWSSFAYLVDRMRIGYDATPPNGRTLTRQAFTAGQTDVPEGDPQYYMEYVFPVLSTPNNYLRWDIEGARTFQGKKATFSFWARVPSGSMTIGVAICQEFGSGGSPSAGVYPSQTNYTVTTAWKKFTYTQQMPSIAGKILGTNGDDRIWPAVWMPTNASGTIQFTNFKLEEGDTATRFNRRLPGVEQQLAYRYYRRFTGSNQMLGAGYVQSANAIWRWGFPLDNPMRIAPTVLLNSCVAWAGGTLGGTTTVATSYNTVNNIDCDLNTSGLGVAVVGGIGKIYLTGASNYVELGAEL
jgi:hypothetical protein